MGTFFFTLFIILPTIAMFRDWFGTVLYNFNIMSENALAVSFLLIFCTIVAVMLYKIYKGIVLLCKSINKQGWFIKTKGWLNESEF
jgi:hypothetical protein